MKKSTVSVSEIVNVSTDKLWQTISSIGGVDKWFPSMIATCKVEGSGPGAKRSCTTVDGALLEEDIVTIDHNNRIFEYKIPSPPLPFENLFGKMRVWPEGEGSGIEWSATFDVEAEQEVQISTMIKELYAVGINGLEEYHQS